MKRLMAILAVGVVGFAAPMAAADESLPAPAIRKVKSSPSGKTAPSTRARTETWRAPRPVVRNPHKPSVAQGQLPQPIPTAAAGESREAFLSRIRAKYGDGRHATTSTPKTSVSSSVRSSFPRTQARRNLTIPSAPDATSARSRSPGPRSVLVARATPTPRPSTLKAPTIQVGAKVPVDRALAIKVARTPTTTTRPSAPAQRTIRRASTPVRRSRIPVLDRRPKATPRRAGRIPAATRPARKPRPTPARASGKKPLTVPASPGARNTETAPPRSLLGPPDCEFG